METLSSVEIDEQKQKQQPFGRSQAERERRATGRIAAQPAAAKADRRNKKGKEERNWKSKGEGVELGMKKGGEGARMERRAGVEERAESGSASVIV